MLSVFTTHYFSKASTKVISWQDRGLQGIKLGLAMSLGFFTIFAGLGLFFMLVGRALVPYLSIYAPFIDAGVALIVFSIGLATLVAKGFSLGLPVDQITAKLRGGYQASDRGFLYHYIYGISYAVGSMGCGFPLFLSITLTAFTGYWLNGLASFFAYTGGMTLMMLSFALLLAYAHQLVRQHYQKVVRYMRPVSGLVLMGLGVYLSTRAWPALT